MKPTEETTKLTVRISAASLHQAQDICDAMAKLGARTTRAAVIEGALSVGLPMLLERVTDPRLLGALPPET